jgi:hypothetical protein
MRKLPSPTVRSHSYTSLAHVLLSYVVGVAVCRVHVRYSY